METINLLRIELAEEVATLPEALRSSYPDLAVDFLYTVFKETASNPITKLPASALEEALAATEAAAPLPAPFPSEDRLTAAKAFTDAIEADAAELAKQSALSTDTFASLLAHREPASGDSCEGSLSGLVKCQRCNKVMFASVKAHHATLCKIRQAVVATAGAAGGPQAAAAPSDSDWQPPSFDTNGGAKGRKRKQPSDNLFPMPPVSKSRLSKDSSRRSGPSQPSQHAQQVTLLIDTTTMNTDEQQRYQYDSRMQPPLSPMLAAAASLRQGRSAPSREKRRQLAYLPNQDLEEPLILNRSPVRGARPGAGIAGDGRVQRHSTTPVPLRLASQNSDELQNRTGTGPIAAAVPAPLQQQQQQQGAARMLSPQQAQQVFQHIQQMRAAHAAAAAGGGGTGAPPAAAAATLLDGKAPHMLPTMPGTLVYRNGALEMQQAAGAMASGVHHQPHQQQQQQQQRYIALSPQMSQQFAAQLQYAQHLRQQQQQQVAGGRGPGAPVLQGGANSVVAGGNSGGTTTFLPVSNGMYQTFNGAPTMTGTTTSAPAMPAAMYHQFVPASIGAGFVPVPQNPTVPQ